MNGINIRKDDCELDFLSLGALVHRLDPGVIPFRKARTLEIHVSGGEYNVAANLADCFGLQDRHRHRDGQLPASASWCRPASARWASRPFYKWFEHDGVRGPNIATVYSDRGHGVRAAGRLLQPLQRGRRAAQARRLRLGEDLRRRRALVPLRRHLRRPVRDHVAN